MGSGSDARIREYLRRVVRRLGFNEALERTLRELALEDPRALAGELDRLPSEPGAGGYPVWFLARHVEQALAMTPTIEAAEAAFRLAVRDAAPSTVHPIASAFGEATRRRWLSGMLGGSQPVENVLELLERHEEKAETFDFRCLLLHELAARARTNAEDHAVAIRLVREMRGHGHPFSALPLSLHPIESEAKAPTPGLRLFSLSHTDFPPLDGARTGDAPAHPGVEPILIELAPPTAPPAWPQGGTEIEQRSFQLSPGGSGTQDARVLLALPLRSTSRPHRSPPTGATLGPEQAFALLFHAGVLDEGWRSANAAWPRFVAWRLLGALTGADATASPDDVAAAAARGRWTRWQVTGGWFDQPDLAWSLLLLFRDLQRERANVLALARVEPLT